MIVDEIGHKIYVKETYDTDFKANQFSKILNDSDFETNKIKLQKKNKRRTTSQIVPNFEQSDMGRLFMINFSILMGKKDKDR